MEKGPSETGMRIFLAGVVGRPLVPLLLSGGREVVVATPSPRRTRRGARPSGGADHVGTARC
jgi:hypothetical protein